MRQIFATDADVPPLPAPPLWERFLLEQPLPLVAVLLVSGLVVAWVLRHRNRRASIAGLLVGVGAAAGLWFLAASVKTTRETVTDLARSLVQAVATGDEPALGALLFADVTVSGRPVGSIDGSPAVIAAAQRLVVPRVNAASTIEVRAVQDNPTTARTQVRVRVETGASFDSNSWWLIVWRLDETQPNPTWVATSIEPLWIQGVG